MKRGALTFALRDVPLAEHFTTFLLCLSDARIDTLPLQPAALVFVSYGFVLIRVQVLDSLDLLVRVYSLTRFPFLTKTT